MDEGVSEITREYLLGKLGRREFFRRMVAVFGSYSLVHQYLESSGLAAGAIAKLESSRAQVASRDIRYPSDGESVIGALSLPSGDESVPALIVIHENRGLNDHIRDIARRFAAQGLAALAPDLLSRKGGTAAMGSPDEARRVIRTVGAQEAIQDLLAAHRFLNQHPRVRGQKVGCVGFCWGGARSFLLAASDPNLAAAVVFYGSPPAPERLSGISCPVMGNYGELDNRVTSTVAATAEAMSRQGKIFDYKIYPGAKHAFFNDTREDRYDEGAAQDAWDRSLDFFRKHLS